jgi:hypothetical protein
MQEFAMQFPYCDDILTHAVASLVLFVGWLV